MHDIIGVECDEVKLCAWKHSKHCQIWCDDVTIQGKEVTKEIKIQNRLISNFMSYMSASFMIMSWEIYHILVNKFRCRW